MKRTILFRGKTSYDNDGPFVYGSLVVLEDKFQIVSQEKPYKIDDIIPETVGQFTGLTDKNGKRIFEGDVVKICKSYGYGFLPKGSHVPVEWCDTELCFKLNGTFHLTAKRVVEVIKNIHDNPELS